MFPVVRKKRGKAQKFVMVIVIALKFETFGF